ncbi:MAG: hypothetical protein HYX53_01760 [Chloroflexi bacterium]|nr:hypothetical protein [Chloroflexota bacterium]
MVEIFAIQSGGLAEISGPSGSSEDAVSAVDTAAGIAVVRHAGAGATLQPILTAFVVVGDSYIRIDAGPMLIDVSPR